MTKRISTMVMASAFMASLFIAPAAAGGYHHNKVNVIMPDDLAADASGWYFYNDATNTASVEEVDGKYKFVEGVDGQPAGKGSLRFDSAPGESWSLATKQLDNTKLKELKKLSFMTYQPRTSAGDVQNSTYLSLDVDFDGVEGNASNTGRLTYVPRDNGEVREDDWQKWHTTNEDSVWRWSDFATNGNKWSDDNTTELRTWAELKVAFPDATISVDGDEAGQVLFTAGEPYAEPFTGFLDKLMFKTAGERKVAYDLEPSLTPVAEIDCQNDGWKRFNDPEFYSEKHCLKFLGIYNHDHGKKWGWWWRWHRDGDHDRWERWFEHRERQWDNSWDN